MKMPVLQSEDVLDKEAIWTVNSAESVVSKLAKKRTASDSSTTLNWIIK